VKDLNLRRYGDLQKFPGSLGLMVAGEGFEPSKVWGFTEIPREPGIDGGG